MRRAQNGEKIELREYNLTSNRMRSTRLNAVYPAVRRAFVLSGSCPVWHNVPLWRGQIIHVHFRRGGGLQLKIIFHAGATVTYQVKEERDAVNAVEGGRHLKMQSALTPHGGLADWLRKQLSATWHQHADSSLNLFAEKSCVAQNSICSVLSYHRLDDSD